MPESKYLKVFLILTVLFELNTGAAAQDLKVSHIRFDAEKNQVIIRYNLEGNPNKKYHIDLWLSCDSARTFTIKPEHVSGDVGNNIRSGTDKAIIWDIREDYPYGLVGDGYAFAVDAEIQKPWRNFKYYVLGGCVVAGGIYFYSQSGKGNKVLVTVPSLY